MKKMNMYERKKMMELWLPVWERYNSKNGTHRKDLNKPKNFFKQSIWKDE